MKEQLICKQNIDISMQAFCGILTDCKSYNGFYVLSQETCWGAVTFRTLHNCRNWQRNAFNDMLQKRRKIFDTTPQDTLWTCIVCLMLVTKYFLDAFITDSSPDEVISGHYSPYNVVYIVSVHSFESFCRKAHSNDVWIDICGHHWVKDTQIEENPI